MGSVEHVLTKSTMREGERRPWVPEPSVFVSTNKNHTTLAELGQEGVDRN